MGAGESSERLAPSLREIWASLIAALLTASHVAAGIIVFGWLYFVVPRWKKELDELGMDVTQSTMLLIQQSDTLVNYWYLLIPLAPVALVVDFIVLRWMARYLGKPQVAGLGLCGVVLILSGMGLGHLALTQELARLSALPPPMPVQMPPVGN